jgi:hypothetical protein
MGCALVDATHVHSGHCADGDALQAEVIEEAVTKRRTGLGRITVTSYQVSLREVLYIEHLCESMYA